MFIKISVEDCYLEGNMRCLLFDYIGTREKREVDDLEADKEGNLSP